jgi:hypothetical protein
MTPSRTSGRNAYMGIGAVLSIVGAQGLMVGIFLANPSLEMLTLEAPALWFHFVISLSVLVTGVGLLVKGRRDPR